MAELTNISDFGAVVREHQAMVFSIAFHVLNDRALAEEVAQDVFMRLYSVINTLQSAEHVLFWLRKVATHRALDEIRRRSSRPEVPLDDNLEPVTMPKIGDPILHRRLQQMVASLPEKSRAVIVLRYQEDMSPEDISRAMEMPVATVKSQLQRALVMLREKCARSLGEVRK